MKHIFWMLVALLALVVAGSFFIPIGSRIDKRHAEEAILQEDLHCLRNAIDQVKIASPGRGDTRSYREESKAPSQIFHCVTGKPA